MNEVIELEKQIPIFLNSFSKDELLYARKVLATYVVEDGLVLEIKRFILSEIYRILVNKYHLGLEESLSLQIERASSLPPENQEVIARVIKELVDVFEKSND